MLSKPESLNGCDEGWVLFWGYQVRSIHSDFKDVSFCGRALLRIFPDVNHYDVQHVAVHHCCDWSRVGLLSGDTADQLIRWQRGDWWLRWHLDEFTVHKTSAIVEPSRIKWTAKQETNNLYDKFGASGPFTWWGSVPSSQHIYCSVRA